MAECVGDCNSISKCDIFDFMAKFVGLSVLHPGGFAATEKLLGLCQIDKDRRILDIACGKGTTSIFIAKKFGCKVIGIDISHELIEEAKFLAGKSNVNHLLEFKVAFATSLPFNDNEFDVTIAQAMLVLIDEKPSVIKEGGKILGKRGRPAKVV